jgi:hypothetical protein
MEYISSSGTPIISSHRNNWNLATQVYDRASNSIVFKAHAMRGKITTANCHLI